MLRSLRFAPFLLLVLAAGCAFFDGGNAPDGGAMRFGGVGDALAPQDRSAAGRGGGAGASCGRRGLRPGWMA